MTRSLRPIPVALLLAALAVSVRSQSQRSTFRAGVDLVQVDVSVLDKERRPVRGLTAADFTLLEDGKPRTIAAFSAVELPRRSANVTPAWDANTASEFATNTLPAEGRLVVILLDRSIPDGFATVNAKNIAKAAVRELGPADLAAVLFTANGRQQGFTNDHARLIAAIDGSYPAGELSDDSLGQWQSLMAGMQQPAFFGSTALGMLDYNTECPCGVCVLDTIGHVADAVRDVPRRRKSLLFIGANVTIEATGSSPCASAVHEARDRMFRALDVASLTVHSFDARGLELAGSSMAAGLRGFRYGGQANLERQGNIAVLPDRTGGRTIVNTNNPIARVPEIFAESDSYYLLGFEPAVVDGRRHNVSVKVARGGVDVRTRRGYVADDRAVEDPAAHKTTNTALSAINGLMPAHDGIDLTAATAVFAAPKTREPVVTIAIHVQHAAAPASPQAAASGLEQVDLVTGVFTTSGRSVGVLRQTLSVTPVARSPESISYDVLQRLPAKAGHYELRIGVQNLARHQTGSVYTFVDVPDFSGRPFVMSDIGVYAPGTAPATADDLTDVLLAPATARREFDRHDRPTAFLRLYQGLGGPPASVFLKTTIVDARNRQRYGQDATIASSSFTNGGSTDYVINLPFQDLEAGAYLLTVDAKAGVLSDRRSVRFEIK